MVEEFKSLPGLLQDVFQNLDDSARNSLHPELCLSLKHVYFAGCGDSHFAPLSMELAFTSLSGLPVTVMRSMKFARYFAGNLPKMGPKMQMVVGISVSGAVARTAEALRMGRQNGITALGLTGNPDGKVARESEMMMKVTIPPMERPEGLVFPGIRGNFVHGEKAAKGEAVIPGARSYFTNQVALLLMAVRIGEVRSHLTTAKANEVREQIRGLHVAIEETIQLCDAPVKALAATWQDADDFVFCGSGPNFATALFSAAKILEASGDAAMGQDMEEWNHLQYFARKISSPTFIVSAGQRDLSRATETAVAAKQIGRRVAVVAPKRAAGLHETADASLFIADIPEMFSPLVSCIPAGLFAAYRSELLDEPFFRNFQGGRNVAEGGGISRIQTSEMLEEWQE
jgi:glucosamine--fructose-6-phosphate aminotransferase (isomerizing)